MRQIFDQLEKSGCLIYFPKRELQNNMMWPVETEVKREANVEEDQPMQEEQDEEMGQEPVEPVPNAVRVKDEPVNW
jgi:hypothetical protein